MAVQTLSKGLIAAGPRCLRSKWRGLLETYSHDFMQRQHMTLRNLQRQTNEQTSKPNQRPSWSSRLSVSIALKTKSSGAQISLPLPLLSIELLAPAFIVAILVLHVFSPSLKQVFCKVSKKHTFQWVLALLWTSWPAVLGSWADLQASSPCGCMGRLAVLTPSCIV